MLTIYIRGVGQTNSDVVPGGKEIVLDVESEFVRTQFEATESNIRLVRQIDEGTLLGPRYFRDRFGVQLYTDLLSTGSKAALVVNNTSKVVDIRECGYNARDAIISICQCGEIVMEDPSISICDVSGGTPVSIVIEGRTFQTIADVNTYIFEERMARFCGT